MVGKNKKIHDFSIEGIMADDSYMYSNRERIEKLIDMQMRDAGYVPHLDLDTQYFISYNQTRELFEFKLVAFGIYVGKKKAWELVGFSGSTFIKK